MLSEVLAKLLLHLLGVGVVSIPLDVSLVDGGERFQDLGVYTGGVVAEEAASVQGVVSKVMVLVWV